MIHPKWLILFFFSFFLGAMASEQKKHDSIPGLVTTNAELQFQGKFYEALKQKGIEGVAVPNRKKKMHMATWVRTSDRAGLRNTRESGSYYV